MCIFLPELKLTDIEQRVFLVPVHFFLGTANSGPTFMFDPAELIKDVLCAMPGRIQGITYNVVCIELMAISVSCCMRCRSRIERSARSDTPSEWTSGVTPLDTSSGLRPLYATLLG